MGRVLFSGLNRRSTVRDIAQYLRGWGACGAEDREHPPRLLADSDGRPTGAAVVVFTTEEAAARVVERFDFGRPLHGHPLAARLLPPLRWDEVAEAWRAPEDDLEDEDEAEGGGR
jgi:hypothetical protein